MSTEHTPGPWEHGRNHIRTGTVTVRDHAGETIAYTTCERQGYGEKQNDAEAMANARLVAAAPDLLGVLQALTELCDDVGHYPVVTSLARATIAKATGEGARS